MTTTKTDFSAQGLQLSGYISKVGGAVPTNGQLLIGDATNGRFSVGSLTGTNGLTVTASAGGVALTTNATSANTPSTIVMRDATGSFLGNAGTATALQTARTINGVSFDGSANISFTTDAVAEGTTNLYYTAARVSGFAPKASPTFTGQMTVPEGTISVPGIVFANDGLNDTGFWHLSDGVFGISNNGAETVRFTTSGTTFATALIAPTASAGTNTTQVATTAFVTSAISAATTGVASFNSRTGAVTLQTTDITSAGGALLASPAFTGIPTAPTPAQFDSSTKIATTAFVAGAGMQYNGFVAINSNTTLAISQVGMSIQWYGATGGIFTLPTSASIPAGRTFYIFNQGSGSLIINLTGGSDFFWSGIVQYTTLTLIKGESLFVMSRGSTEYDIIGGTTAHKYAARQLVNTIVDDGTSALQVNGIATATTPTAGDSSTKLATTAFVAANAVTAFNTRQGAITLSSADITSAGGALLASPAFTGTPTGPTAALGTNTTQLATTAFVKNQGFQFTGTSGVALNTSTTLTVAQLGCWFQVQIAGLTITLPEPTAVAYGATYTIMNSIGSTGFKTAANANMINALGGVATTYNSYPGETITFVANGTSGWYAVNSGFGSGSFFGTKASIGYQKLPGGIIIQWGASTSGTTSAGAVISYPIAFPNAALQVVASDSGVADYSYGVALTSASQFTLTGGASAAASYTGGIARWIAIGY